MKVCFQLSRFLHSELRGVELVEMFQIEQHPRLSNTTFEKRWPGFGFFNFATFICHLIAPPSTLQSTRRQIGASRHHLGDGHGLRGRRCRGDQHDRPARRPHRRSGGRLQPRGDVVPRALLALKGFWRRLRRRRHPGSAD